jgi:hypothetical protein
MAWTGDVEHLLIRRQNADRVAHCHVGEATIPALHAAALNPDAFRP